MPPRVRAALTLISAAVILIFAAVRPEILPAQNSVPAATTAGAVILHPADLAKVLPAEVFFRGQKATLQLRNSGGVRWPEGLLTFAALVDTAGYSSAVAEKYQAYLITEAPLLIAGKEPLPAGAYGVGFFNGNFIVMDLGGHDLFAVPYLRDSDLKRPLPLAVTADSQAGTFRLYSGRNYVIFASAGRP